MRKVREMTSTSRLNRKAVLGLSVILLVAILTAGTPSGSVAMEAEQSSCSGTPIITALTISPPTIQPGQTATLYWGTVQNAEAAYLITPSQASGVGTPGQMTVNPNATTTYTLMAVCGNNRAQKQVTLAVASPGCSGTPVITSFTAEPLIIQPGQQSTLSWGAVQNAEAAGLQTPEGLEGIGTPGQKVVQPSQSTTYVVGAYCGNQLAKRYVTVVVQGPHDCSGTPNIEYFVANPPVIARGGTSTLQYGAVTNASGAYLSRPDGIVGVSTPGETVVQPEVTSVYSLYALCGPTIIQSQAIVYVQ
jgi:hypothetical protein